MNVQVGPVTVDKQQVKMLFETVVAVLAKVNKDGRKGAVCSLQQPDGTNILEHEAGMATREAFARYLLNARNKNTTLKLHPAHTLSWQSHSMETGPYPGGVRATNGLLLAISGFAWQEDEVGSLWVHYKFGWMSYEDACMAANISGTNSLWLELFPQFNLALESLST